MNTISSYCWMFLIDSRNFTSFAHPTASLAPLAWAAGAAQVRGWQRCFCQANWINVVPGGPTLCAFKSQRLAVETDVERDVCSSWFEKIKLSNMDKSGRMQSYTSFFFVFISFS